MTQGNLKWLEHDFKNASNMKIYYTLRLQQKDATVPAKFKLSFWFWL